MNLGADNIPLPCSLRELVLDRYGEPPGDGNGATSMQPDELLEYLKHIDDFNLSPLVAIKGQAEALGDPAAPSQEQVAILCWLDNALGQWEKQFPLEDRLAAQVRRLKPLLAAISLLDSKFLQPGAHPLHQLLDNIQARAIGWQSRLDRVGVILEQQVTKAVDESRGWFENNSTDLAAICTEFSAAAERDRSRALRMVQRVVETEAGKVKTAAAKQEAARMINTALGKYSAPAEIGEFIKGPWYSSAQLLLLKFGSDSEQWQKMSSTTDTLLDSLQSLDDVADERRQYIFEVVTQLPKEMRRWLLSLHHDTEEVNEAMGLVEFAHLRILRRQPLVLQRIEPIRVDGDPTMKGEEHQSNALKNWHEGQWFIVENGEEGVVRVQLVLKVEQSQQLLFTNLAGLKVLQLSFAQFSRLMAQGKVTALYSGASFSLCLAHAVGIDSVEILDALVSALSEIAPEADVETASAPIQEPESVTEPEAELDSETDPEAPDEPSGEAEPQQRPETEETDAAPEDVPDKTKPRPQVPKARNNTGFLIEQAEEIRAQGGYVLPRDEDGDAEAGTPFEQAGDGEADPGYLSRGPRSDNEDQGLRTEQPGGADKDQGHLPGQEQERDPGQERSINLPMGAWLGFHDGDTPLMARLAVHDPGDDYYIFVNRQGVKMRQVSRQELLALIDSGLVDILQTNSNFREEVTEVRKNLDQ